MKKMDAKVIVRIDGMDFDYHVLKAVASVLYAAWISDEIDEGLYDLLTDVRRTYTVAKKLIFDQDPWLLDTLDDYDREAFKHVHEYIEKNIGH